MLSSKIIEYEAKIGLAEMIIKNIEITGIDTLNFSDQLNKLREAVTCRINEINNDDNDLMIELYTDAINTLEFFLEDLNQYKIYFQAINRCLYIYNSQNEGDSNKEELSEAIDELIKCLDSIKASSSIKDKNMIESLYEVIFNIIKLESELNGSSKLLSYCKKDSIDSIYISKFIMRELENLRNSNYDVNDIDLLIMKMNFEDNANMYLDGELVRLISICRNKETYLKDLSDSIEKLTKELKSNNAQIKTLLSRKRELTRKRDKTEYDIKIKKANNRKAVIKSAIPFVATLGVLASLGYGVDKFAGGEVYMTSVQNYSSETGLDDKVNMFKRRLRDNNFRRVDENTTIKIYEPWVKDLEKDSYERTVKSVVVTGIDLEDLKEYLNLDFEKLGYEFYEGSSTKTELSQEDMYDEPICEVTRAIQDVSISEPVSIKNTPDLHKDYIAAISLAIMAYMVIDFFASVLFGETFGIESSAKHLFRKIWAIRNNSSKNTHYDVNILLEIIEEIESVKQKMDELIQNNEDINMKYQMLMQRPEYNILNSQYQEGIALIKEYIKEFESGKKLALKNR